MSSSPSVECGANYTTSRGLNFSIFCDRDLYRLWDIDYTSPGNGVDTVEECFDQCSFHPNHLCAAAVFREEDSLCFFKSANATTSNSTERHGRILGIANKLQLQPRQSDCKEPIRNITTQNGLDFTLYCNQTTKHSDICSDEEPERCRSHADTIEECLEYCSIMRPLCTSVDWDPDLRYSWLNCYPKNLTASEFGGYTTPSKRRISTAIASFENIENIDDTCRSDRNTTMIANNGDVFELSCAESRLNNNDIATYHAISVDVCVDLCTGEIGCVGVVFDSNIANGYENCYLKSATGVPIPDQSGFAAAMRQNKSTPNSSTSTTQQPQGSKAWMAGPIIGAVVAVAVIVAGLWWCWHFHARKKGMTMQDVQNFNSQESWQKPELSSETWPRTEIDTEESQRPELEPEATQRRELDAEAFRRPELHSNTENVPKCAAAGFREMRVNELPT